MDVYNEYGWADDFLTDNERVLWRGAPEQGHLFTPMDIFLVPFSVMWCGFAIFWEVTAILSGAPVFFCLFGIPFVFVGLFLVFGRFIVQKRLINNTRYVVTDKRALRYRNGKVDFIDYCSGVKIHTNIGKNGCGTITFGEMPYPMMMGYNMMFEFMGNGPFMMTNIPQVNEVYKIIEQNRAK